MSIEFDLRFGPFAIFTDKKLSLFEERSWRDNNVTCICQKSELGNFEFLNSLFFSKRKVIPTCIQMGFHVCFI